MSGSLTPNSYPTETVTVRCDHCGHEGRYRRSTLAARFGADMPMPDILNAITEACGKNAPLSADRCKAVYVELLRVRVTS